MVHGMSGTTAVTVCSLHKPSTHYFKNCAIQLGILCKHIKLSEL